MKIIILVSLLFTALIINAQNVGIGTTTPSAKLEVKNLSHSKIKISSGNYSDSSSITLSNRNNVSQGTDFIIASNKELGLSITSASDIPSNKNDSLLTILPGGNVGIGTLNPSNKLQVHDPTTTALLNVTNSSSGLGPNKGMISGLIGTSAIVANLENGNLRLGTNNLTRVMVDPVGNVGIGNLVPAEKLDISGNINLTGMLKANGISGQSGEVLMSSGSSMVWAKLATSFDNFISFKTPASTNWTVPAGVTKIMIEAWGGGGGGAGNSGVPVIGGGGGGYVIAIAVVTPGAILPVTVGAGGTGGVSYSSGGTSSVSIGTSTVQAFGGLTPAGGTYSIVLPGTTIISYDGDDGENGTSGALIPYQLPDATDYQVHAIYGNGGNSANSTNTGGIGGVASGSYTNYTYLFAATPNRTPRKPGGGGCGTAATTSNNYNNGASGKVTIRW